MKPALLTFAEAESLGQALHDHWAKMADGKAPMKRDDMAWADVVQFVLRKARDVVDARAEAEMVPTVMEAGRG